MVRWLIWGLLTSATCAPAFARSAEEAPFSITGSVRARYEALNGQARPGLSDAEDVIAIRTLVLAEYQADDLRIGTELQDSRVYGADQPTSVTANDVNTLEVVQAYVERRFDDLLGKDTRLTALAGRFTLALGSRRLIAADEYRNTTNGSTGIRLDLRDGKQTAATLFWVMPQRRLPEDAEGVADNRVQLDREGPAFQFFGIVAARQKAIGRVMAELSVLRLYERDSPGRLTRDRRLVTISGRLFAAAAPGRLDGELEVIGQWGHARTGTGATAPVQQVEAGFLHADVGYQWPGPAQLRLSFEYDLASGDRPGGANGRFDTLFGMRRADLAPAGLYQQIGRTNISTPAIRIEAAPAKGLDCFVAARALWLASARDAFSSTGVRDPSGRSGRYAGEQIEGRVRYAALPWLRIEANAAWLHKGRFLRDAPNAPPGRSVRYWSLALTGSF